MDDESVRRAVDNAVDQSPDLDAYWRWHLMDLLENHVRLDDLTTAEVVSLLNPLCRAKDRLERQSLAFTGTSGLDAGLDAGLDVGLDGSSGSSGSTELRRPFLRLLGDPSA